MKTLGLIGGTSWHSTVDYYRLINQGINDKLGGLNAAKIFLYSVNLEELKPPADPAEWAPVTAFLSGIAQKLVTAGADCLLLCANTPHMVAGEIQQSISVPLLHIAEVTAHAIAKQDIRRVGLLGTKLTMEQNFFKEKLAAKGIEAVIPGEADRDYIHNSIFAELGKGIFSRETKERYLQIMNELCKKGIEAFIFACTEIPLLIKPGEASLPVFDTTVIHAAAAVDFALG